MIKDILEENGEQNLIGSKDCIRKGFTAGIIDNGEIWMEMMQSRNEASHLYDGKTAAIIAEKIFLSYNNALNLLYLKIKDMH